MHRVMPRHRNSLRLALVLIVSFSVFAFADGPAHACSCAGGDPRDALHAADAAFVGALRSWDDLGDGTTIYTFSVRRSIKGGLRGSVDVESATDGATCGFEVKAGRRIGILLHRQGGGVWYGGLCTQIDPDVLITAGQPLPASDGEGPVRLIVGGNFGEARVLALDGVGRTLGYGYGDGVVLAVSMCPAMTRFVEAVSLNRTGWLVVRDTATLEVVREVSLITGRFPSIDEVSCLTDDGELLAAAESRRGITSVHVVRGPRDRVAFAAEHVRAWFQGDRAYVASGSSVARLQLWGGSLEPVAQIPAGLGSIEVSRDEGHVGGVRYGGSMRGNPPSEVVVVRSADGSVDSFALRGWNDSGDVHWLDDRHVVYLPGGADDDRAHVLSLPGLVRAGGFRGWYTATSTIVHGCARGVGWGTLFTACLPDGPVRTRRLVGPETFTVTSVSGHVTLAGAR
ncbi:MAG: hypothetical protein M3Q20_00770 [Actinomycetota bacterium]|nr:hypothetical protein [Actinomycetota bacterium]